MGDAAVEKMVSFLEKVELHPRPVIAHCCVVNDKVLQRLRVLNQNMVRTACTAWGSLASPAVQAVMVRSSITEGEEILRKPPNAKADTVLGPASYFLRRPKHDASQPASTTWGSFASPAVETVTHLAAI